jgi:hypothetical protein
MPYITLERFSFDFFLTKKTKHAIAVIAYISIYLHGRKKEKSQKSNSACQEQKQQHQ